MERIYCVHPMADTSDGHCQSLASRGSDLCGYHERLKMEKDLESAVWALKDIWKTLNENKVTLGMMIHCHKMAFTALEKIGEKPDVSAG